MVRLPSSLKWLIDRRARVEGEIKKIERSLARCEKRLLQCQELAAELKPLKELLASVDQTLSLHEIQVDPLLISTVHSKDCRLTIPHGELSRAILISLKLAEGKVVSSSEIVDFVAQYFSGCGYPAVPRGQLAIRVRVRLRGMLNEGQVIRHHAPGAKGHGQWSLAQRSLSLNTQTPFGAPDSTL